MNRIHIEHQIASLAIEALSPSDGSTPLSMSPVPAGRLIVLVPADADYTVATRRIWELAIATSMHVQLLGLCKDVGLEPSLRRQLVTMSALMGNGKVSTEAKIEIGANWVDAVKRNYQTGDMIVCFAEQRAGLLHRPLNQILEANLDASVYILSGLYTMKYSSLSGASQAIAWIGSIGIIAGFFLLQSRIALLPNDWILTTLLVLTVLFEFWLILVWNSLFD